MICTFYSYKGGVGRSMALANVADILSRRGLRVLMIDFDLEAPGLEQFFYRGDEREQRDAVRRQTGLLDLLLAYKNAMSVSGAGQGFRDIDRYIAPIFARRPGGGRLDLMPAGQRLTEEQLARYALNLRSFDWQDFYFNWEGDLFFEWLRRTLEPDRYDVVLVDSRTGVTEMGGICGYQLADVMVMMCSANHQNVDGTWSMLQDFRSQAQAGLRRGRALEIVVVPARVEQQSQALLDAFQVRFAQRFEDMVPDRLRSLGLGFMDLAIPYDPLFAFEERVARGQEEAEARQHLSDVFGTLADVIAVLSPLPAGVRAMVYDQAGSTVARDDGPPALLRVAEEASARLAALASGQPQADRMLTALARYDEARRFAEFDIMLDAARDDMEQAQSIRALLLEHGLRVFLGLSDAMTSADWALRTADALAQSRVLVMLLGSTPLYRHRRQLLDNAVAVRQAGRELDLVALLLPGHRETGELPRASDALRVLDLRHDDHDTVLRGWIDELYARPDPDTAARPGLADLESACLVEQEARCPYPGNSPSKEHQAELFFGREREISDLLSRIEQHEVTILVGPSACGKTSLVNAGLLPAVRRVHPDWTPVWFAMSDAMPTAQGAQLVIFDDLPGRMPDAAARDMVRACLDALPRDGARLLVVLRSEQFPAWRGLFAAFVRTAPERFELRVPDAAALREIIERPADVMGLALEPGLVDRLLHRADGEPGALPFLQTALQRLWEQRRNGWLTNAAYDAIGGIRGVVVDVANAFFDARNDAEQDLMRRILLRLVKVAPGGPHRATALRVGLEKLESAMASQARTSGDTDGQGLQTIGLASDRATAPCEMVSLLIASRLLVSDLEADEPVVEPAHESLVRDWARLQVWLEQEHDFLAWQAHLATELEAWKSGGRHADQLLRGPALDNALRQASNRDLTQEERHYIQASLEKRDRKILEKERSRKRRHQIQTAAMTVFLVLSAVAIAGWGQTFLKSRALQASNDLLIRQLSDLDAAHKRAEDDRVLAQTQLVELQQTLNQALRTASAGAGASSPSSANTAVYDIRRAVEQAERAAEYQADYSAARVGEITRQQEVLRGALRK